MLARLLTLIRTDPALVMSLVQAALAATVSLGYALTAAQTGAVEGAVTAVLGFTVAAYTRPFRTGAATALVSAVGTVLLAWKVPHISSGLVSTVNVLVTGVLMLAVTSPLTDSLAVIRARHRLPRHAAPRMLP
jgi:hypothetical protein